MPLTVTLNGQARTFDAAEDSSPLSSLLAELGLKGDRVAVELNGTIVPRGAWPATQVATNDRLEVVHFVGGGSEATSSP